MMNNPEYPIGTITNFGRVMGFIYRISSNAWIYTLQCDSDEIDKVEHKLEFVEASLDKCPEPAFSLGDPVAEAFVCGILQHEDCNYSYYLSSGRDTPYIHWVPQEKAYAKAQAVKHWR